MLLAPFFRGLARHLHLACLALTATTAAVFAQTTPSAADGFDPNVDGNVLAMAKQADGNLIVVGQFTAFYPNGGAKFARNNVARLLADGTGDNSFNADVDGAVRAVVIQSDKKIVIGGDFTHVNGVPVSYVARLLPTGELDTSFEPTIGTSIEASVPKLTPQVLALAINPKDGSIIVGGNFWSAASSGSGTTVICHNLARFATVVSPTGTIEGVLDTKFPQADGPVRAILPYTAQGSILVGGGFTHLQPAGSTAVARGRIARINPDDSIDSFDPEADNDVSALALQPDGMIIVGGVFANLQPNGAAGTATAHTHLARLDSTGTPDKNFYPAVGGNVFTLAIGDDGGLVVGGHFTQVWGRGSTAVTYPYVVRFNLDGSIDQSFSPGLNFDVSSVVFQADGKMVLGGYFTRAQPDGLSTPIVRNRMARVLPSGALDTAFQLDPGGRILASVVQKDGRIVVAGTFTSIGGATHNHLARLNADGTVDTNYKPDVNGNIYTLAYESSDDKVIIGGTFTTLNTFTRNHIARVTGDGLQDDNFNPNIDGQVNAIRIQTDGSILVGGAFTTVQPIGQTTATTRANLLRLTSAGQLDTNFNPTPNSTVNVIALEAQGNPLTPDGKILIAGSFSAIQPGASGTVYGRNGFARLNADGSLDTGYNPNPNGPISAVAFDSSGKAVVGGQFTAFLPPGATTVVARNFLARINVDGTIDTAFDPHPNFLVFAIGIQSNGQILVGGAFTAFQTNSTGAWKYRDYFARLNTDGSIDTSLDLGLNEQTGNRVDSINVLSGDTFLIGGSFASLQPNKTGTTVARANFAKLAKDGSFDPTSPFDVHASGTPSGQVVNAIALQPDGRLIVGGSFSDLGGAKSTNIARFNPEGTADTSFNAVLTTSTAANDGIKAIAVRANANVLKTQLGGFGWFTSTGAINPAFAPTNVNTQGQVNAMYVQSDGKVILAGSYSDLSDNTSGNFIRFNANGVVDFFLKTNGGITAMAVQKDGKILIGGDFTVVNGVARNHIARLDPALIAVANPPSSGAVDMSFDPNASAAVSAIVIQPSDQKIVIGGSFTSLTPNGATTATTRNYLGRLNTDGTVDTTYNPNPNQFVSGLALTTVSSKDAVIAVGGFTTIQPGATGTATSRNYVARINNDGTLDTGFDPNANGTVSAVAIQSDQKIVLGGAFTTLQPNGGATQSRNYLARLNADGTLDTTPDPTSKLAFYPIPNGTVSTVAIDSTGRIVIGGSFTSITSSSSTTAVARNHVARLAADGTVDSTFNPDVAGNVSSVYVASDNSVLVGGAFSSVAPNGVVVVGGKFSTIGGLALTNLAELNADGSVNGGFTPNPNGEVDAVLALPSTQGFVVGGAFTNLGTSRIARFKNDGTLDAGFSPSVSGSVSAIALQSDGMLIVGADSLVRLKPDGSTDTTFNGGSSYPQPAALAVQPDGRILVAASGARIVRLNSDGTVDATFTGPSFSSNATVNTLTLQSDGKIIVAGSFTSIGGNSIGNLARLNSNGSVDSTFNPAPNGSVTALALQSDGRVMIGGTFTAVGGLPRVALARISNTAGGSQTLMVSTDGSTIEWDRTGTVGTLEGVTFDKSSDGQTWTELGAGSRIGSSTNWQYAGAGLTVGSAVYVRARGITPSSAGTSTGIYQSVKLVNVGSTVAGANSVLLPVQGLGRNGQYAWVYDPVTGTYQTVDLSSGLVVNLSKVVGYNASTGAMIVNASSRLINLSTRADVTAAQPLIGGFAITGTAARPVLIRAVGPSLSIFGVTNFLKNPQLIVRDQYSNLIASNTGWKDDATLTAAAVKTGAFPLKSGSADSAVLLTLNPGTYTVQVADAGDGSGGNALVEIYDAGDPSDTSARIVNLSGRAVISSQGGTVIGGLVINGNAPKTLLIRGVGPSMAKLGISNPIADPAIAIYNNNTVLTTNDNWNVSTDPTVPNLDLTNAVINAAASVGAFQFDSNSKDAAMIVTLTPGVYTVQLTGVAGSGTGMIEVYELP